MLSHCTKVRVRCHHANFQGLKEIIFFAFLGCSCSAILSYQAARAWSSVSIQLRTKDVSKALEVPRLSGKSLFLSNMESVAW